MIALVFDRLSPEARRLAVQAAQGYLGTKEEAPDYIGIFGIDLSLAAYAPFTRNAYALRQALDPAWASRASAGFNSPEQQQQKANADQQAATAGQAAASAQAAGGPGAAAAVGGAPGEAQLAQMQSNMIRDFQIMERDQQGYATTNGLFAIINTLGRIPGRKSLVLFSEGIAVPPAVHRLFLGVIDAANRANVSIYTMDAAGLRAESEQAHDSRSGERSGGVRRDDGVFGGRRGRSATRRGSRATRSPCAGIRAPASGRSRRTPAGCCSTTPTTCVRVSSASRADLRNYYLVGYTPSNDKFDGRFRDDRGEGEASGRHGRGAQGLLRGPRPGRRAGEHLGSAGARRARAEAGPERVSRARRRAAVPRARPAGSRARRRGPEDRAAHVPATADGKTYTSDFTVLVRFLDGQNQVARKVSQHYEVRGPIAQIERAKQGEVIFYRESELPAGVYTMETVVYDAPSGKSSVRFSTVEVPKSDVGQAAHEQPHARQARARRCRRRTAAPTTRCSSRT